MTKTEIPAHLLQLPAEVRPKIIAETDTNDEPNLASLNGGQIAVFNEEMRYLEDKHDDIYLMIVLIGFAGTGKTFLTTQLMKQFLISLHGKIAITAPTNKAVKVLRQAANYQHGRIEYSTCHKLLGLVENIDETTGKQTFIKGFQEENKLDEFDVLVVDETSMLPDDLFQMFHDEVVNKGLKIIFLGDPIQIPPVNKPDCIPFLPSKRQEYRIHDLYLTEPVRQKDGSPILELANLIRQHYKERVLPYERINKSNELGSVTFISRDNKEEIYHFCDVYFSSEHFKADADFVKIIAWTNKTVDFMNRLVRSYIYRLIFPSVLAV